MQITFSCHGYIVFVLLCASVVHHAREAKYTLGMNTESSCTKTHFYEAGDVFTASVKGRVYDSHCPLTFIRSGSEGSDTSGREPCVCLCVKITEYTLESCQVQLSYHDGLNDFNPATFDCHKYPPIMWCSSKNDLKVTVSELSGYRGQKYAITLEVKPFCGRLEQLTTDSSVVAQPQRKGSSINQTAVIIGAIVGTISILFVLGWLLYCYRNRHPAGHGQSSPPAHQLRPDRGVRGNTPNQQSARYAPVDRNPPSSQSSSDRCGMVPPYLPDLVLKQPGISVAGDRRLYSPFQPPSQPQPLYQAPTGVTGPRQPGFTIPQQQVLYSDLDRGGTLGGGGGDGWFLGDQPEGFVQPGFVPPTQRPVPANQYMAQNQIYQYPQDGEMHTAPTDTRYVVYDFDYEPNKLERKFSAGKSQQSRRSPVKDIDRTKPREITPLRETIRVLPPLGGGQRVMAPMDSTTDHTSDNESSYSDTTEDDTTTDDQMGTGTMQYGPPLGFFNPSSDKLATSRLYDSNAFQRIDNDIEKISLTQSRNVQSDQRAALCDDTVDHSQPVPPTRNESSRSIQNKRPDDAVHPQPSESAKEGPMPQVPSQPRDIHRMGPRVTPPWPHGPPPPYSAGEKFVV
ncbi:uncharacterized protein LOC127880644 isoform X2 [Dreissena polymorpha]|uniref:CUB domain-containing protein n=1 Tax=Dreissena polymorpha TaxID=45954 RepID=A0A9D4RWT4_DREPO|nr:uncharacterized protein LOC127880644 isoform X2 [Dreissena polymorpha]KAH3881492.1 hypothetical protein DPMN_005418 [Dreissena polymorpha]